MYVILFSQAGPDRLVYSKTLTHIWKLSAYWWRFDITPYGLNFSVSLATYGVNFLACLVVSRYEMRPNYEPSSLVIMPGFTLTLTFRGPDYSSSYRYGSQYHGCWCPCDLRRKDISSHDIASVDIGRTWRHGCLDHTCPTAQYSPTCELSGEPSRIAGPGHSIKCIFVQLC